MAAVETFQNVIKSLSAEDRAKLKAFISDQQAEMFAARSEDARTRIAQGFVKEVHELLKTK